MPSVRYFANAAEVPRIEKSEKAATLTSLDLFTIPLINISTAINTVTILGRVGADPQKRGSDDHPVVTFSVATHNNYK